MLDLTGLYGDESRVYRILMERGNRCTNSGATVTIDGVTTTGYTSVTSTITYGTNGLGEQGLISQLAIALDNYLLTAAKLIKMNVLTYTGANALTTDQSNSFVKLSGTAPYTITTPTPVGNAGLQFAFWNSTSGTITLSSPAGQFTGMGITAANTYAITTGCYIEIISDGSNWFTNDTSKITVAYAQNAASGSSLANQITAITVAPSSKITPTLTNGFTALAGRTPKYWKDSLGYVHFEGNVATGTSGASAFILPSGYRPITDSDFACVSGLALIQVSVSTTGYVYVYGTGACLNGVVPYYGV